MKKILNVNTPYINGFNLYADLFSIIPETEDSKRWICNNFIQLRYLVNDKFFFFEQYRTLLDNCPFYSHYTSSRELLKAKWNKSISNFLIDMINLNSYIFIYIDRYFISNYEFCFHNLHIKHELFIYGYDTEKRIFYCADNLEYGKYSTITCSFDEVENGYWGYDATSFFTDVHCLTECPLEKPIKIKYNHIKKLINEYANSIESTNSNYDDFTVDSGMNSVKKAFKDISLKTEKNNEELDIRPLHTLYEHKVLMTDRLEYLSNNDYSGKKLETEIEAYRHLKDEYFILRNTAIKYNVSRSTKLLNTFLSHADDLIKFEEKAVIGLLEKL